MKYLMIFRLITAALYSSGSYYSREVAVKEGVRIDSAIGN